MTVEQIITLNQRYTDPVSLEKALVQWNRFLKRYLVPEDRYSELKALLTEGHSVEQLQAAYAIAQATGFNFNDLLAANSGEALESILASLNLSLSTEEKSSLNQLFQQYPVNQKAMLTAMQSQGRSVEAVMETIVAYEKETARQYALLYEKVDLAGNTPPQKVEREKYFNAPFSYRVNDAENISANTGGLTYESTDLSLSGKNGLDLNITSRYDSQNAKLYDESYVAEYYSTYTVSSTPITYVHDPINNSQIILDIGNDQYDSSYSDQTSAYNRAAQISSQAPVDLGAYYGTVVETYNYANYYQMLNGYDYYTDYPYSSNYFYPPDSLSLSGYSGNLTLTSWSIEYQGQWQLVSSVNGSNTYRRYVSLDAYYAGTVSKTTYSYIGEKYRCYLGSVDANYYSNTYNTTTATTYDEQRHNLGSGWSLGFSSIEIDGGQKYLHHSSGSVYPIEITAATNDSNLKNYTLQDMRLETDSGSYSNGTKSSQYVLIYKDGKKEYFADDGRLLAITDRFGNTIKFEHTMINGQAVISKITDTAGRIVTIAYQANGSGKKVVITAPDQSTIEYFLDPIPGYSGEYQLTKKIDQLGRVTQYTYTFDSALFSFFNKSYRDTANVYANLKQITYPTGATSQYTYEKTIGNLGNQGSNEYFRIKTRKDMEGTQTYQQQTYQYTGSYTGYSTANDPANLPSTFTYGLDITNGEGTKTSLTFNYKHLKTNEAVKENGTILTRQVTYEYDANKLPVKVVAKTYNKSTGQALTQVENYAYDAQNFGDLIGSWDSQNQRDTNNLPTNDEHKTTYTYQSTYHYLTSKTYKQSATHTIKEEYTSTSDGKGIEWVKIYDNNVLQAQSRLLYDSYGNVTEEQKYLDDWTTYQSTFYSYADNVAARNGQLSGVYLTRQWVTGVKDADGVLIGAKSGNAAGTVDEVYTYDLMGHPTEHQDGMGNATAFQYDTLGRVIKQTNPDGSYRTLAYSDTANTILLTDENGNSFKYGYDGFGHIRYEQDVTSGILLKSYEYDSKFRVVKEANANNIQTISYTYDAEDRLVSKQAKDSSGAVLSDELYEYTNAGGGGQWNKVQKTVVGETNAPAIVTASYSDVASRIIQEGKVHDGSERLTTYTYDYLGNKISEKSARAISEGWTEPSTQSYEYNYAGKLTKTTEVNGDYSTTQYNALGQIKSTTDSKGNKANPTYATTYTYDALGRKIKEEVPFEKSGSTLYTAVKTYAYDRNGNLIRQKVTNNQPGEATTYRQTDYAYNNRNFLTQVTTYNQDQPENYTQYYYDKLGNKLRMYTGLSNPLTIIGLDQVSPGGDSTYGVTKYEYDRFNQLTKYTDPEGRIETYTYDLNKQLTGQVDKNGSVITQSYDALGRLLSKSVTNTQTPAMNTAVSYTYTQTGAPKSMSGGGLTTTYTYDDLGRKIKESQTNGVEISTTYDDNDNRKTLLIKVGGTTQTNTAYTYDKLNRLSEVRENGVLAASYTYDENGNRKTLTYGNGITTEYQYNLANLPISLTNKKGSTTLSGYTYTYTLDGNQASKTDQNGKVTAYSYDGLGRLTEEAPGGEAAIRYTYDDSNNRASMAVGDESLTTYAYDKSNRLLTESKEVGEITAITRYTYDHNGNQIYSATETLAPAVEGEGASLEVSIVGEGESGGDSEVSFNEYDGFNRLIKVTSGSLTATYTYNGEGLRISKTVNGVTTQHVWDGDQMALELDSSGAVTQKYVRGINLIYAERGGVKSYYLFNGHGDVVQLTDASGAVTKNYDYDAFGNDKNADENDTNVFRYSGEYYDKETGTIYLRARYYDPTIGRFISEDSVRSKKINLLDLKEIIEQENNFLGGVYREFTNISNGITIGEYKEREILTQYIVDDPLSLNLYTYCYSNPIINQDPTGHFVFVIPMGIIAGEILLEATVIIGGLVVTSLIAYGANEVAKDIIGKYKKGSIWGEFPSEYSDKTMEQIERDAKAGKKAAQKAKKLLKDKRFDKGDNRK